MGREERHSLPRLVNTGPQKGPSRAGRGRGHGVSTIHFPEQGPEAPVTRLWTGSTPSWRNPGPQAGLGDILQV